MKNWKNETLENKIQNKNIEKTGWREKMKNKS